jgi:hypothetical protein
MGVWSRQTLTGFIDKMRDAVPARIEDPEPVADKSFKSRGADFHAVGSRHDERKHGIGGLV